jgi:growth factor-regulated tyrosine kinase substrate
MESCVKNCGQLVHDEVCTKAFMEELRELVKHSTAENVKQKILEMLQTWGMAFRNQSKYRIVTVRARANHSMGYNHKNRSSLN